jgi:RNA polymerase sigma-70 factor (ECF subfamily)
LTTNADLTEWLARVALRDRAAFERVYRATSAHLLGVAFRILGRRERAEEVLQEAFMAVWHNAGTFDAGIATPMTWLINIVRNRAIDSRRSGRAERETTHALDDDDAALSVAADDAALPAQLLEDHLTRLHIDACMAALPAPQRQALALAYYRGLVHTEVAEVLSVPLGTAKAWVRRGLDRLKSCLEAAGLDHA